MRRSAVAPVGAVAAVAAVDQLLLRVGAHDPGELAEAGLDGGDAGKGRAGAALKLVLHLAHQAWLKGQLNKIFNRFFLFHKLISSMAVF